MAAVVAVVPARWASSRFPGKPLARLCGRSVVARTLGQVQQCRTPDRVVLATDDERIRAEALEHSPGVEVVMTDPRCLSGSDRVLEACLALGAPGLGPDDVVVNVQGDEPLVRPEHVDALVTRFLADGHTATPPRMATLAVPESSAALKLRAGAVKVVVDAAGDAMYFSRSPIPHVRVDLDNGFDGQDGDGDGDGDCDPTLARAPPAGWLRHVGIYAFRFSFLQTFAALPPSFLEQAESLEQLRALEAGHRIRVYEVPGPALAGIDTPEDLADAEAHLGGRGEP